MLPTHGVAPGLIVGRKSGKSPNHRFLGPAPLLQNMSNFVCDEPLTGMGVRRILAAAKYDVAADGVGERVYVARRLGRLVVSVDAHSAEIGDAGLVA
jgi:hypothetical protein